jgi:hypothetical protein
MLTLRRGLLDNGAECLNSPRDQRLLNAQRNKDADRVSMQFGLDEQQALFARLGNKDGMHIRHTARHLLCAQLQQGWGTRLICEHSTPSASSACFA